MEVTPKLDSGISRQMLASRRKFPRNTVISEKVRNPQPSPSKMNIQLTQLSIKDCLLSSPLNSYRRRHFTLHFCPAMSAALENKPPHSRRIPSSNSPYIAVTCRIPPNKEMTEKSEPARSTHADQPPQDSSVTSSTISNTERESTAVR
jgi:hypothetical protein